MSKKRLSVADAKVYWMKNDPTVCVIQNYEEVWALPRVEVERGLYYVRKLETARTVGQAQEVFNEYFKDQNPPKLLPQQIVNFLDEDDFLADSLENLMADDVNKLVLSDEEISKLSNQQLFELVSGLSFELEECHPYRDEAETLIIYGQASLWTDAWIPAEIAEKLGVPDEGLGMDYYPAEYLYLDIDAFEKEFISHGISVFRGHEGLRELSGY
jgi:hypothetical protein